MVPVLTTLRLITWQPRTVFVHCNVDHASVAPRSILKKQVEAAEAAGYNPMVASELEYYAYGRTVSGGAKAGLCER